VADIKFTGSGNYVGNGEFDSVVDESNGNWDISSLNTLTSGGRQFSNINDLTTAGKITEQGTFDWSFTGFNKAIAANINFHNITEVITDGSITNASSSATEVLASAAELLVSGITFIGSGDYSGSDAGDSVIDQAGENWQVLANRQAKSTNDRLFDGISSIKSIGDIFNSTGESQLVTVNGSQLNLAGIDFIDGGTYTGSNELDTVVDLANGDWHILADNMLNNSNRQYNKVRSVQGHGKVTESTKHNWQVDDDSANAAGVSFIGAAEINTEGDITNIGARRAVNVNGASLHIADIEFVGTGNYIGSSSFDSVNDLANNNWHILGEKQARDTTREFRNIDTVSTSGAVTEELTQQWAFTANNAASAAGINFKKVSHITTEGTITNMSGSQANVVLDGDKLAVAGIEFVGRGAYFGNNFENSFDTVTDLARNDWDITGDRNIYNGNRQLDNISQLTNAGNVNDVRGNDWSVTDDGVANDRFINVVDSESIATTGVVSNATGESQIVSIGSDGDLRFASMRFKNASQYAGDENQQDSIDDRTNSSNWQITGSKSLSNGAVDFSEITALRGASQLDARLGDGRYSLQSNGGLKTSGIYFADVDSVLANVIDLTATDASEIFNLNGSGYSLKVGEIAFDGSIRSVDAAGGSDTVINHQQVAERTWSILGDNIVNDGAASFANMESIVDHADNITVSSSSLANDFVINAQGEIEVARMNFNRGDNLIGNGNAHLILKEEGSTWRSVAKSSNASSSGQAEGGGLSRDSGVRQYGAQSSGQYQDSVGSRLLDGFVLYEDQTAISSLDIDGDIVYANNIAQFNNSNLILGNYIDVTATGDMSGVLTADSAKLNANSIELNTTLNNINATTNGDLSISELDNLTIESLISQSGNVYLTSTEGSIYALERSDRGAHIQGNAVDISAQFGQIGDIGGQTIVINAEGDVTFVAISYVNPIFTGTSSKLSSASRGVKIANLNDVLSSSGIRSAANTLVTDFVQLDPAIFTDIKPFSVADSSILTPSEEEELQAELLEGNESYIE
ncbi:hypothetical protein EDC56_2539, partial [Sinobacterium caligoides]